MRIIRTITVLLLSALLASPATDYYVWIELNGDTSDNSLFYFAKSTDDGLTWNTPSIALNLDDTPPPVFPGQDTLDANTLSLGTDLTGKLGMLYTSWAGYYCPIITPDATFGPGVPIDPVDVAGSQLTSATTGPVHFDLDGWRNYGPLVFGGNMFIFSLTQPFVTGINDGDTFQLGVYKSTDGGASWARLDKTNAPLLPAGAGSVKFGNIYWDGTSSTVTIVFNVRAPVTQTETVIRLVDFDMTAGTFGTAYAIHNFYFVPAGSGSGAPLAFMDNLNLSKLSNGSFRLLFSYRFVDFNFPIFPGQIQSQVYFTDFDGANWSALTVLPNQTTNWGNYNTLDFAVQSGDTIHAGLSSSTSVGMGNSWYAQIALNGSFPVQTNITPAFVTGGYVSPQYRLMQSAIVSGNALLITTNFAIAGPNRSLGVIRGTPLSNPVFSFVDVAGAHASPRNESVNMKLFIPAAVAAAAMLVKVRVE